jgi:lysophospholipase L1-like esterase
MAPFNTVNEIMKKPFSTLIISTVIFIALLFGAEFLLGLFSDQEPKRQVARRHILLKEHSPNTSFTYNQPIAFFSRGESNGKIREVRFEIDQKGYIEPSNLLNNPDVSIAFLGGSTTECSSVAESKRFPYVVGQLLNKDGLKVNTLNAGVSGNTSPHTLNIYLNKVIVEEPDIAVMMHSINDLHILLNNKGYWGTNGIPDHIIVENRSFKSALFNKVSSIFPNMIARIANVRNRFQKRPIIPIRKLPKLTEDDRQLIFRQFEENLKLFISISRIKGITPVLMTQASRIKNDFIGVEIGIGIIEQRFNMPFQDYKVLYAQMNQVIRDVCEEESVLIIDLDMLVAPEYIYDSVHFTDEGSEFVAGLIAEQLTPLAKAIIGHSED